MPIEYDRHKIPSAPVLHIQLSPPRETARMAATPALIDTGADFSLAPLDQLLQIDAPEVRWAYLRGLWSEQRQVTLYLVDLHFDNTVLPGVEVVGIEAETEEDDQEIVLGRNVLNRLILLLDGPQEQVDILERRPKL